MSHFGDDRPDKVSDAILVYDGDCPFCNAYVRMLRLRDSVALELVDARTGADMVGEIVKAGFDLDEGMVLRMGGAYFHGDDCIHALALLSTPAGVFNRMNAAVFRSRRASRWLYPVLRFLRNLTLKLLRRAPLDLGS